MFTFPVCRNTSINRSKQCSCFSQLYELIRDLTTCRGFFYQCSLNMMQGDSIVHEQSWPTGTLIYFYVCSSFDLFPTIEHTCTGADPEIFSKGGGVKRKIFVDSRINAFTH